MNRLIAEKIEGCSNRLIAKVIQCALSSSGGQHDIDWKNFDESLSRIISGKPQAEKFHSQFRELGEMMLKEMILTEVRGAEGHIESTQVRREELEKGLIPADKSRQQPKASTRQCDHWVLCCLTAMANRYYYIVITLHAFSEIPIVIQKPQEAVGTSRSHGAARSS